MDEALWWEFIKGSEPIIVIGVGFLLFWLYSLIFAKKRQGEDMQPPPRGTTRRTIPELLGMKLYMTSNGEYFYA